MNDVNSDKTGGELQSLFLSDKSGNTHVYDQQLPSTQPSSTNTVSWNCASPDDMLVEFETSPAVDSGENISYNHQCVEILDHQKSLSDFIRNQVLHRHKVSTCQSSILVNTEEPNYPHNGCDPLEAVQGQCVEPSLPFVWKSNSDLNCTGYPTDLELNQTFDSRVEKVNCTSVSHHAIENHQSLLTPGNLQPTRMRIGNTSLSSSTWASSQSDRLHVRETSYEKEVFENPEATPSETQDKTHTAFSDVMMQTEVVVPDFGNQCQYSSGKVTSEYTDGSQQKLVGEKEIQALTPVSDGVEVPSRAVLQEVFCLSKDEPNSETHSQSSYGQKEMGQNLRETVSNCLIDYECPLLVPTFDKSKAQVLNSQPEVTVIEDTQSASNEKDLRPLNQTTELILSSPPGQKVTSSLELTWDANDIVFNTDNSVCMSTPILEHTNAKFSIPPVGATEKCNTVGKNNREFKNLPDLKGTTINMPKSSPGKSTAKTNTPIGSKVRRTEIISYPRPNFKNVKAKVMSRPVLQSKDAALSRVTPKPQLTNGSSPSSVSSTRHLTVLSKTPRPDLNADTKAEILTNKMHKQQFNKLITSQAVHVTTHSKMLRTRFQEQHLL